MLSGAVLKQFRTYLKSQVGHGWSEEGTYAGKDFKQECTNFFGSYRCKSN